MSYDMKGNLNPNYRHGKYCGTIHQRRMQLLPEHKRVKCEICDNYYRALNSHLSRIHNITAKEYKKIYNAKIVCVLFMNG